MESSEYYFSCAKAREIDLIGYLNGLGFTPEKIKGNSYWYKSPLRIEGTASFKVNRRLNRWYDFGSGQGGNIIDFGISFHNCSVRDFLQMLSESAAHHTVQLPVSFAPVLPPVRIKIKSVFDLRNKTLIRYLNDRGIATHLAVRYCKEISYQVGGRNYYGIGFKNDSHGYEVRSTYFKGSLSPKDITLFRYGNDIIMVFEGFIDFLSYLQLYPQQEIAHTDFLILNSLAFFDKACSLMNTYSQVHLYLDHDAAGKAATKQACTGSKIYSDRSGRYKGFKDLNDFLTANIPGNSSTGPYQSIPP